jgi:hypothetical protein
LQKINYEKLKEKERIMFFDDVILYEDELDDNGCSKLSVKIVSSNQSIILNSLVIEEFNEVTLTEGKGSVPLTSSIR